MKINVMQEYKSPRQSETVVTEVVCPNDTNPMGMLQGGRLVQWMDVACAVCAQTHAEQICVTSYITDMQFRASAKVGEIITVRARVTRAFNTSMEINVKAWSRNVISSKEQLINEAFFTFVAIDDKGKPTPVPGLKPGSPEDLKEFEEAALRKNLRSDKYRIKK